MHSLMQVPVKSAVFRRFCFAHAYRDRSETYRQRNINSKHTVHTYLYRRYSTILPFSFHKRQLLEFCFVCHSYIQFVHNMGHTEGRISIDQTSADPVNNAVIRTLMEQASHASRDGLVLPSGRRLELPNRAKRAADTDAQKVSRPRYIMQFTSRTHL